MVGITFMVFITFMGDTGATLKMTSDTQALWHMDIFWNE